MAVGSELGEARVGIDELLRASLRMRPDRLMVGEIRGPEAFTFLRAVNTGHPGSLTTVHADSPEGALEQIAFMTLQAGLTLTRADVIDYAQVGDRHRGAAGARARQARRELGGVSPAVARPTAPSPSVPNSFILSAAATAIP